MPDRDALLFANETFYRAFDDRDIEAMDDLWSKTAPIACIHPGWGVLEGRDDVMESWIAIISNPNSPGIVCRAPAAFIYGDTGVVICYEELQGQFLVATNVFVREGRIWKMVHHQSGPTSETPAPEVEDEPDVVN